VGARARVRVGRGYVRDPPLIVDTWRCSGGRTSKGARAAQSTVVREPLSAGTCTCCSGCGRTDARGMRGRVASLLGAGTWRCCNGRGRTTARGTH